MKKIFALLSVFVLTFGVSSCDIDDDSSNFYFEALKITDVEMPESFDYGQIYRINVTYQRPSTCHYFEGFDYNYDAETVRTIIAVASVIENQSCEELQDIEPKTYFDFEVRYKDPYTFHFYAGLDENGEKQYLTYEVAVNN